MPRSSDSDSPYTALLNHKQPVIPHRQPLKLPRAWKNAIRTLLAGKSQHAGNFAGEAPEYPSKDCCENQDIGPVAPEKLATHRRARVCSDIVGSCNSPECQINPSPSPRSASYTADMLQEPLVTHQDIGPCPFKIRPPCLWDESWRNFSAFSFKGSMSIGQCLYVLRECPNLQQFECSLDQNPHWEASSHATISCVNLTHLTIKTSIAPKMLFDRLRLHKLAVLTLQWTSRIAQFQPPDELGLAQMLRHSESQLHSLSLIDTYPTAHELIHILRTSQSLESLVIRTDREVLPHNLDHWMASKAVLGYLSIDPVDYPCPSLRSIEMSPCYSDDGLLADMVELRSTSSLYHVTYSFDDPDKHLYDMKRLQKHQELRNKQGQPLRVVYVVHKPAGLL